jgi:hypothetical protein
VRSLRWIPRALFVVYCLEAGIFLVMAPWSRAWLTLSTGFPFDGFRPFLLEPVVRGLLTGFGLVHLVWGAHDLELWLGSRRAG